jgi:rod shape-determining protein MreD
VRQPGLFAEVGITRVGAVGATMILAFALQTTLLQRFTILSVVPQLVLVVVVSLAYVDGERIGMTVGFFAGLLLDLQLPTGILGLSALVYTLVGYGVGSLRKYGTGESVWLPVVVVAGASAVGEASYALMAIILGQPWVSFERTATSIGLVVLYNTLLTPFVFPLVRRIADRFRPERVYRW